MSPDDLHDLASDGDEIVDPVTVEPQPAPQYEDDDAG